jgi:hypothetical protein
MFGLMYRDTLNILIIEGKCAGTFGMSFIMEQNVLFQNFVLLFVCFHPFELQAG